MRQPQEQILGRPLDELQQVVEVVNDAAGESADRFHLLKLPHLLFALPDHFLGDVMSRPTPVSRVTRPSSPLMGLA